MISTLRKTFIHDLHYNDSLIDDLRNKGSLNYNLHPKDSLIDDLQNKKSLI